MSFTRQQPFTFTTEHAAMKWGSRNKPLGCNLCGTQFAVGSIARWVHNSTGSGNFFTCDKCDGEDVKERANASFAQAQKLAKQWEIYGPDWQKDMQ